MASWRPTCARSGSRCSCDRWRCCGARSCRPTGSGASSRPGRPTRAGWAGWRARAAWRSCTPTRRSRSAGPPRRGWPASRTLWHVREIYAGFERWFPAYRRLLLSAQALPCVSRAACLQFDGAPEAFVLHDGLAVEPRPGDRAQARAALGLAPDAFVIAVLGRVSGWKGQDVLVSALGADPLRGREDAIALVAGAPARGEERHRRELHALAARLGVAARLYDVGFQEDVELVHGAADVDAVPRPGRAARRGRRGRPARALRAPAPARRGPGPLRPPAGLISRRRPARRPRRRPTVRRSPDSRARAAPCGRRPRRPPRRGCPRAVLRCARRSRCR
jgi:hypothetical protein